MPVGLQIFNPATGGLKIDLTTRTGRIVAHVDTNGARTGSLQIPSGEGQAFYFCTQVSATTGEMNGAVPSVSISGNTLTWDYETIPSPLNHRIHVGRF